VPLFSCAFFFSSPPPPPPTIRWLLPPSCPRKPDGPRAPLILVSRPLFPPVFSLTPFLFPVGTWRSEHIFPHQVGLTFGSLNSFETSSLPLGFSFYRRSPLRSLRWPLRPFPPFCVFFSPPHPLLARTFCVLIPSEVSMLYTPLFLHPRSLPQNFTRFSPSAAPGRSAPGRKPASPR